MLTVILPCVIAIGCAMTTDKPGPSTAAVFVRASAVDDVLDALDARGRNLQAFTAEVKLIETDSATGDDTTRNGTVAFQTTPDGSARIRVVFDKKQANNRISQDKIEYLLAGAVLIDRTYRTKTQVTRQVLRPGQKLNLFRLGEGPFPLPLGQKKEDVHAMFQVSKIETAPNDPVDTVHLRLVPRPGTQFERRFTSIDVWVDVSDHMPRQIQTVDRNEVTIRTTQFANMQVNPALRNSDFELPKIDQDNWQLIDEAYAD